MTGITDNNAIPVGNARASATILIVEFLSSPAFIKDTLYRIGLYVP
jgi:hypothetical protein